MLSNWLNYRIRSNDYYFKKKTLTYYTHSRFVAKFYRIKILNGKSKTKKKAVSYIEKTVPQRNKRQIQNYMNLIVQPNIALNIKKTQSLKKNCKIKKIIL